MKLTHVTTKKMKRTTNHKFLISTHRLPQVGIRFQFASVIAALLG